MARDGHRRRSERQRRQSTRRPAARSAPGCPGGAAPRRAAGVGTASPPAARRRQAHQAVPRPAGFHARAPAERRRVSPSVTPLIVEPLSPREIEVLQGVAGMLPTEEIAAKLYVSVNTVKTHVRSILRKLSASRRNEAVRRARSLGLI